MLRNYTALQRQLALIAKSSMVAPAITPHITTRFFTASQCNYNTDDEKSPVNNRNGAAKDEGKGKEGEAEVAAPETPSTEAATTTSTEEELKAVSLKLKELQVKLAIMTHYAQFDTQMPCRHRIYYHSPIRKTCDSVAHVK